MKLFFRLVLTITLVLAGFTVSFSLMARSIIFSSQTRQLENEGISLLKSYYTMQNTAKDLLYGEMQLKTLYLQWLNAVEDYKTSMSPLIAENVSPRYSPVFRNKLINLAETWEDIETRQLFVSKHIDSVLSIETLYDAEKTGILPIIQIIRVRNIQVQSDAAFDLIQIRDHLNYITRTGSDRLIFAITDLMDQITAETIHIMKKGLFLSLGIVLSLTFLFFLTSVYLSRKIAVSIIKNEKEIIKLNRELESKVTERTEELAQANEELLISNETLIKTNSDLENTLEQLHLTQDKLVKTEKFALVGQIYAGISHGFNTPLAAIKSSAENIQAYLTKVKNSFSDSVCHWKAEDILRWNELTTQVSGSSAIDLNSKRKVRKRIKSELELNNIKNPEFIADLFIQMEIPEKESSAFIQLIRKNDGIDMCLVYSYISGLSLSGKIIETSRQKLSEIVRSIKTVIHDDLTESLNSIDIAEHLESVIKMYYSNFHDFVLERDFITRPVITASEEKLELIWINIINNALQATGYQGKLVISLYESDGEILVSFTDNGPGIDPALQENLLSGFTTTKKYGEGSGLGLTLSQRIIGQMNGYLSFESIPGKTTFTAHFLKKQELA